MRAHIVGGGFREQLREVHSRQQQIARAGGAGERIAQHGREHLRRGALGRRVERRDAKRPPDVVAKHAVLPVLVQQRVDAEFRRKPERLPLQGQHEQDGVHAFPERNATAEQQAGGAAQPESVGVAQVERQPQERAVVHADLPHQAQQRGVGTDQDVLAVVEFAAFGRDAPRAPARYRAGFENGHRDAALRERDGRRHAGVAGPHHSYALTHVFQASQSLRSGVSDVRWVRTLNPSRSTSASVAR